MTGGRASAKVNRKAVHDFYVRNKDSIRAKRNAQERINHRKKDRTTPNERARAKLRYAVWAGNIVKPKYCERCAKKGLLNGHHNDYTKPLEVEWLCSTCHGFAHAKRD